MYDSLEQIRKACGVNCRISNQSQAYAECASSDRDKLFNAHKELTDKAIKTMKAKNHDYASDADPYRNFQTFGLLGILVRLSDKLARLRSFTENGEVKVSDESVEDTIIDIINYAVLFEAMRRHMRGNL
jgi:anti-sigma28 factor (negative regulator of flagellin synthesis)